MRTNRLLAASGIVALAGAAFAACTGEDAVLTPSKGLIDGGGSDRAASEASPPGDGDPTTCGARDTTPCNCGPSKSCCFGAGATASCYERGTEDQDAASGCTSTSTVRCVADRCGAGRVCCFNGSVTSGTTCPKRMTDLDTECLDVDAAGGFPCVDPSNGATKVLMCAVDADCAVFDAGTCVSALMGSIHRVMGVCAR